MTVQFSDGWLWEDLYRAEAGNQVQKIRFTKLIFEIQMLEDCELTAYKVSALRGGMGQMLLLQNCINHGNAENCEMCAYRTSCIVQNVMYAPFKIVPEQNMPKNSPGYIIDCRDMRRQYKSGDRIRYEVTLFGDVISYVMPVIYAFSSLGAAGLGEKHARFQLVSIWNRKKIPILSQGNIELGHLLLENLHDYVEERMCDASFSGKVVFYTPYCIKYQGSELDHIIPEALILSLRRRIYMLALYEGLVMERPHYEVEELPSIVEQSAKKKMIVRYSSTNNRQMSLKGMQGYVQLEQCSEDIQRLLYAGEIVHVGKNVHFGFGSMKVE